MVSAESLPTGKSGSGGYISRASSVTSDVNRNINRLEYVTSVSLCWWCIFLVAMHLWNSELVLSHTWIVRFRFLAVVSLSKAFCYVLSL